MIIRGAGPAFCAGYDLGADLGSGQPYYTAGGLGVWPRHVSEGCFRLWDLAKPVIAQVHGYCLAGGSELAAACDLVYVAEDAQIGYPAVRAISPPDNQFYPWVVGMRAPWRSCSRAIPSPGARRSSTGSPIAPSRSTSSRPGSWPWPPASGKIPSDLQQINKRAVHRQMEIMGIRAGIRAGTGLQVLATLTEFDPGAPGGPAEGRQRRPHQTRREIRRLPHIDAPRAGRARPLTRRSRRRCMAEHQPQYIVGASGAVPIPMGALPAYHACATPGGR